MISLQCIDQKELHIEYWPTAKMVADYMTKPLTGPKFEYFHAIIMSFKLKK